AAAAIIEVDDFFQRSDAAIMHVRGGASDLTESRRLESTAINVVLRDGCSSGVGQVTTSPRDTGVVELVIAEERARMASVTACLTREKRQAPLRGRAKSGGDAGGVPIVGSIARNDRPDERRKRSAK